MNESNVNSLLADEKKVRSQKRNRQWKRGVNESPVPNIFDWPDINSSGRCVVSHSHWTRHDIMLQTFLKTPHPCGRCVVSGFQIGGSTFKRFWLWQRTRTHTHVHTHTHTHTHTHKQGAEEADYSSWRWCQRGKQTGVIIDGKHRPLGTTTSTENSQHTHTHTHTTTHRVLATSVFLYTLHSSEPCVCVSEFVWACV